MLLPDTNVLVYAHREDAPRHSEYRSWLESVLGGPEPYGLSDLVASSLLRIVTHPRVFDPPSPLDKALRFVEELRAPSIRVSITPGTRHFGIFVDLCRRAGARGNLIPDAYLAALAIEHGCEWMTTDGDFARFPNLRWRHPLDGCAAGPLGR